MFKRSFIYVAILFVIFTPACRQGKVEHPQSLNGVWNVVSSEIQGAPDRLYAGHEIRFSENQMVITGPFQQYTMSFTVDSDKKPSHLNIFTEDAGDDPKPSNWIYELDGDTLKLCWNGKDGTIRPEAFETDENSDSVLLVLERGLQTC